MISSASARKDDEYSLLRQQVLRLLDNERDLCEERALALSEETWQCLHDSLNAGILQHNCHRAVARFEYAAADPNPPGSVRDMQLWRLNRHAFY